MKGSKNVLIVEDSINTRNILRIMLEEKGYSVLTAINTQEAMTILHIQSIGLIILDVMLPGEDGFTFSENVRKNSEHKDIPIVFCTAKGLKEDVIRGLKAGGNDYIVKPFSKKILIEKVSKIMSPSVKEADEVEDI